MSRKRDEIIEKSKFIFGDDAFDYSLIDNDVTMSSKINLICKKCNNKREISVCHHLSNMYGCKICQNTYVGYNKNDTEEEAKLKTDKIIKGLSKIKEKYRKKLPEKDLINELNNDEDMIIEEFIKYLKDNNYLPDINIGKDVIYKIFKCSLQYNDLYKTNTIVRSH